MPIPPINSELSKRVVRKRRPLAAFMGWGIFAGTLLLGVSVPSHAIPPDTPITNTATATYRVAGVDYLISASDTVVTDSASGNSAPAGVTLTPATIDENSPGAIVGTLTTLDSDPGDTHTYSTTDPRFSISGDQLSVAAGVGFDFELAATTNLDLLVTDSQGASRTFSLTVAINDLNESPTAMALDSPAFDANTVGATVGEVVVTDPDAGDVHGFSVDDPRFEVAGTTLKLRGGASLPLGASVDLAITATDSGGLSFVGNFTVTATPTGGGSGNNSQVSFLMHETFTGAPVSVGVSQCDAGAGFADLAPPVTFDGTPLVVPGVLPLLATELLKSGQNVFVQVVDSDADIDPSVLDSVDALISTSDGDSETLRLLETDVASGTFVGYLPSEQAQAPFVVGDCSVQTGIDVGLTATYVDAQDPVDSSVASAAINPLGRVFYSVTGQPVDGVVVTLLDVASGLPAAVGGEAPGSVFPATVTTGAPIADDTGAVYNFPPGAYRYPAVAAGDYQVLITPPNRFRFPSVVADDQLQLLPDAPYRLDAASRGLVFRASGLALAVDLPLDIAPVVPTDGTLELLSQVPSGSGGGELINAAACFDGSSFVAAAPPLMRDGTPINVPGVLELGPAGRFNRGEALFLKLTDPDQDVNPFVAETLIVQVQVPGGPDAEQIRLAETGASTGVFTGYLQSSTGSGAAGDCLLQADAGSQVEFAYTDPDDPADTASAGAVLDPPFTVFSSADGRLVDGVVVTLVDAATGLPAAGRVFGNDGVSTFPATVTTGSSATDSAGNRVDFADGTFRFPLIMPGTYRFQVQPAAAYQFPSVVPDVELSTLPAGPYLLTSGSRGGDFTVAATGTLEFDLPLDPLALEVFVSKQASKDTVAVGDFLQYEVLVQNPDPDGGVADLEVIDLLPAGFRYMPGSAQINDAPAADPRIEDNGRLLRFDYSGIAAGGAITVRYVAEVTAGASLGQARNEATVTGVGIGTANTAFADVTVREDLLQSKAFVAGQVLAGGCGPAGGEAEHQGLAGVRIWLEDGTYVLTDDNGRYHMEGVEPGSHVVQLDTATLPESHEVVSCADNTRFAGSALSQFVDLMPGSLWQADFHTREKLPVEDFIRAQLFAEMIDNLVEYRLVLAGGEVAVNAVTGIVMLPDAATYVPGSLRVDGTARADPPGVEGGALTVRLGDAAVRFSHEIRFNAAPQPGTESLTAKGVVMFTSDAGGKQKTPVMTVPLLLKWPETLTSANVPGGAFDLDGELVGEPVGEPDAPREIAANVYEPSRGGLKARSDLARVAVAAEYAQSAAPYELPDVDNADAPRFDRAWLSTQSVGNQLLWPGPDHNPRIPAVAVAAKHKAGLRPQVLVNGELINALTYVGTTSDRARGVAVSQWDNVAIAEGNNLIEVVLIDSADEEVSRMRTAVHFGGAPVRAELVPGRSYLVADGVTPPMVAVRLFDREGYPARPGITGEFSVSGPLAVLNKSKHIEALGSAKSQGYQRYLVREDGVAFIQFEPTTEVVQVAVNFEFDEHRRDSIRARLKAGSRDWILVGLVEGQLGYNDVSGNMDAFRQTDLEDDIATEGRMAFYAKGMIQGKWLLTAAYDTDKDMDRQLRQQIDPNRFYTLYGDGAEQRYDAESQAQLYLKVDRDSFAGLFGDFDTGFDDTELTRFSRTLNGLQVNNFGERWQASGFASNTDQAFIFDEIRGDGTSGTYHLSERNLVLNSERVSIVTRNRFHTEEIIDSVGLTRYLDYTINYDEGSLIFKQPVFSQDSGFNPIFIEVTYEIEADGGEEMVAGARLAYRLDDADGRVGFTYVDDATQGREGNLLGMDLNWEISRGTTVKLEAARTDTDAGGSAGAYLLEVEHQSADLAGRAYLRQQEAAFGLGQQSALEGGTRKYGLEGEYRITPSVSVRSEAFRQEALEEGGDRTVMTTEATYVLGNARVTSGMRSVSEEVAAGEIRDGQQLTLGVAQNLFDNRVMLRADAETALGNDENTDYPTRSVLGAEFEVFRDVRLIAEQEFTWGDTRNTQDSRLGVKARPWTGADLNGTVQRQMGENGERLFATTGLLQQIQLDDHWRVDLGADRTQTLKSELAAEFEGELLYNPNLPPASGSVNNDFTALFGGVGFTTEDWDASMRLEFHHGDRTDKWNYLLGASRQLADGKVTSASMSMLLEERADGAQRNQVDLRWGLAWRPLGAEWMVLNRLDLVFDETSNATFDTRARKLVNNMNANLKSVFGGQLSLQLGLKYQMDTIDGEDYDGLTALAGMEYRRDFSPRWDWGMHGSSLASVGSNVYRYSVGASVGHNLFDNAWVSLGYNVVGFEDEDFVAADYTAQGPFLKFRMKVDQSHLERFLSFVGQSGR